METEQLDWPESVSFKNAATRDFNDYMNVFVKQKVSEYKFQKSETEISPPSIIMSKDGDYNNETKEWVNEELLTKFHPDKVDINAFWRIATKHYPQFSICGGIEGGRDEYDDIEEINKATFGFAHNGLGAIDTFINHKTVNIMSPILEIGPGYGGFKKVIDEATYAYWYGIDVNPLFEHENLLECDGRRIPNVKGFPKQFHGVYSINVFQHLSVSQRDYYYQEAFDRLVDGGIFVFGLFALNDANRGWDDHWSTKDDKGNIYCHFFNQFTLIEEEDAILKKLEKIGFECEVINDNKTHYRAFKCIKIKND